MRCTDPAASGACWVLLYRLTEVSERTAALRCCGGKSPAASGEECTLDAVERPMVRSDGSGGKLRTVDPADDGIMVTGAARMEGSVEMKVTSLELNRSECIVQAAFRPLSAFR